jgi:hypothetical protein
MWVSPCGHCKVQKYRDNTFVWTTTGGAAKKDPTSPRHAWKPSELRKRHAVTTLCRAEMRRSRRHGSLEGRGPCRINGNRGDLCDHD